MVGPVWSLLFICFLFWILPILKTNWAVVSVHQQQEYDNTLETVEMGRGTLELQISTQLPAQWMQLEWLLGSLLVF